MITLIVESTGDLDEENTEDVISMFHIVREESRTMTVLATRNGDLAKRATRTVLTEEGRVVSEDSRPDERKYGPNSVRFWTIALEI